MELYLLEDFPMRALDGSRALFRADELHLFYVHPQAVDCESTLPHVLQFLLAAGYHGDVVVET